MFANINKCFSTQSCHALDDAILNYNIDSVKYISSKLNIDYLKLLYSDLQCTAALNKAKAFRDLAGCKYILHKCNQFYPNDLYKGLDKDAQIELTSALVDLEGLKYIYNGTNHLEFYSDVGFSPYRAAVHAIELDDLIGIATFIKEIPTKQVTELLKLAYYKGHFKIAEFLINDLSVNFDIRYLMRSNTLDKHESYNDHLQFLDKTLNFTHQDYLNSHSLISAMFHVPNDPARIIYSNDNNANLKVESLFKKRLLENLHPVIQDIIRFNSINSFKKSKVDFILPSHGKEAFFYRGSVDHPYKDDFIYLPFSHKDFNASLIHELSHVFFYFIFENNAKPFLELDYLMNKEYSESVNKTMAGILQYIVKDYESYSYYDQMNLLVLNYWYLNHPFKDLTRLTNTLFTRFQSKLNADDHSVDKVAMLNSYYRLQNWTEDFSYVLESIFDYITRDSDEQATEFLVRIPELYALGINDTTMDFFKPSIAYWEKYITPQARRYVDEHFQECKTFIYYNQTLDDCHLNALFEKQLGELLVTSVEAGCFECVKTIHSQNRLESNIGNTLKQMALSKAAEGIGGCVKYCISSEVKCNYVQPFSFISIIGHWILRTVDKFFNVCFEINKHSEETPNIYNNSYVATVSLLSDELISEVKISHADL